MIDPTFYDAQATVDQSRPCYIERQADRDLLLIIEQGVYPLLLSSRKVGKSSLIERAFASLQRKGYLVAKKELTIAEDQDVERWCYEFASDLATSAAIRNDFEVSATWSVWWRRETLLSPVSRLFAFIRKFLLECSKQPWVIAIDEIETTIRLPFRDDLFATLRSCVTNRAGDTVLKRLHFIVAGVTTPAQLIRDSGRTPFNIGQTVKITDFKLSEAAPLLAGLGLSTDIASPALTAILRWTDGHPYLTQRLFKEVASTLVENGIEEASEISD